MLRKVPRILWVVLPLAYFLYFFDLGATGLLGPDEPRYASIAREMARSADWITPRLWGEGWFEKPALLYWMSGTAFRAGLGAELAPRLPVAFLAVGFLAFYWWILNREFGCRTAWLATLILGTSGAWLASSQIAVPDLPLAATFSAAMLLALPWVARREQRFLPEASALLALAVLAKALVPLALAAPLVKGRYLRDLLRWRVVLPFAAIALPWYVLCYLRNGPIFPYTLFWQHHVLRATSNALMHVQPWWFYLPVLVLGLLPWCPLLLLAARPGMYRDPRHAFLLAWFLFGLVLFSVTTNKLPGYLLPLIPAVAALMAISLDQVADARPWLACCGALLVAFLIAARILPAALVHGLTRAPRPAFEAAWLLAVAVAALAWMLEARGRRLGAVLTIAAGAALGTIYLKSTALPEVDRTYSARGLWREVAGRENEVCVNGIQRNWRYGLNYYSVTPLAECSVQPKPLSVRQTPGHPPYLAATVDPASSRVVLSPFRN